MSIRSLQLLVALFALLVAAPCMAADAVSSPILDAQNANLVEGSPQDLWKHWQKWERREATYKRIGWVGAGFALAGDALLVGAYFTGAPAFWGFGVPFAALGTALILPGSIVPAYGLVELGAHGRRPTLGYVAVGLGSVATMCALIAFMFYANDFGYSLSDGTVVFTTASMLLMFASHGFAIRQMVVDTRVRRTLPEPSASARRPHLRVSVTPRIDRAPGVALVGTF